MVATAARDTSAAAARRVATISGMWRRDAKFLPLKNFGHVCTSRRLRKSSAKGGECQVGRI